MKTQNNIRFLLLPLIFLGSFFIIEFDVYAQECSTRLTKQECIQKKKKLEEIEKLLVENKIILKEQNEEARSLQRDISIVKNEIYREQLGINARNIEIQGLTGDIQDTDTRLVELKENFNDHKNVLKGVLQKINKEENRTILHLFLSRESISSFFQKIGAHKEYNTILQKSIDNIRNLKLKIEDEHENLISQRHETLFLKEIQEQRAYEIEIKKKEQEKILNLVNETQEVYENIIDTQEKSAAQIRSELFNLLGTKSITIKDAIDLAQIAEKFTSVDAAFILAIIEQETSLGKNLGTGVWRVDMHPTRDRPLFLELSEILGVNPDEAPVSKKLSYGWGGAMGPAQFIPSTWACFGGFIHKKTKDCRYDKNIKNFWAGPWSYSSKKDRIRQVNGNNFPSSPWNPQDAFIAAGLFLGDLGANKNVYGAKWCASLRYYSGSCSKKNQSRYSFYPDTVEKREAKFESYIEKF